MNMTQLRYVVLHHTGVEVPHFDVMFETAPDSLLATYRVSQWPIEQMSPAQNLGDHRRIYLTYEGPIAGDRGHVRRVASGACNVVREGNGWAVAFFSECALTHGVRFEPGCAIPFRV